MRIITELCTIFTSSSLSRIARGSVPHVGLPLDLADSLDRTTNYPALFKLSSRTLTHTINSKKNRDRKRSMNHMTLRGLGTRWLSRSRTRRRKPWQLIQVE